jgi:hypothetical protein
MVAETHLVVFSGLDPVPIRLTVGADVSQAAIFAAACLPSSRFMQTVRPFRLRQHAAASYELVLGPEGFGAVLLEALQWLASVTAAGILGTVSRDHLLAFVQQYLELEKPEWRFEELTEHAAPFIRDRYQRAADDAAYRAALADKGGDPALATLGAAIQRWVASRT